MAYTYNQNFDSLNDGNLNGQDSWSVSTTGYDVTSNTSLQGTKLLSMTNNSTDPVYASRSVSAVLKGEFSFRVKVNTIQISRYLAVKLVINSTGTEKCGVFFNVSSGKIRANDNSTELQSYYTSTAYLIRIVFDNSTNKYDVYVNGIKRGDQLTMAGSSGQSTDKIAIYSYGSDFYFDDIQLSETLSADTTKFFNFF